MSRVCILYEQNPDPKATTILGVWSDIPLESVDQFGLNRLLEQIESEVGPQGLLCIKSPNNNLRLCILGVCVSTYVGKRLP